MTYSHSELFLAPTDFAFGPKSVSQSTSLPPLEFVEHNVGYDISGYIIGLAVNSAVYLKQTSIPSRVANITEGANTLIKVSLGMFRSWSSTLR